VPLLMCVDLPQPIPQVHFPGLYINLMKNGALAHESLQNGIVENYILRPRSRRVIEYNPLSGAWSGVRTGAFW
jgi:hypothetical protein